MDAFARICTDLPPWLPAAMKSAVASSSTFRLTVSACCGAGLAFSVNTARPPSVTRLPPSMPMTGVPSSSVMWKPAVPLRLVPPARPEPLELGAPRPTVIDSRWPSSSKSDTAETVNVALRGAPFVPLKVMRGELPDSA